jgi:TrmH family RNA methyltransferase
MLDRIRIVLLSPSGPANVGAVCRAMANMGLRDLVLVAPRCDVTHEEAVGYAVHGDAILKSARVVDDIRDALTDCVRTYATSSKLGIYRRQVAVTPDQAAPEALDIARDTGPVAFVFGREDYGMTTRELLHFDRVVSIPADETYPVLNLAASVMVMCYELRRAWLASADAPPLPKAIDPGVATDATKQVLFDRFFDALEQVGFLYGQNPDHLKYSIRHLFGRVNLGVNEADILIGMAQQILWYVRHHPQRIDPPEDD